MTSEDTVEYRLSQLHRLRERGFISEGEFEAGRTRLVARLIAGQTMIEAEPIEVAAPVPQPEVAAPTATGEVPAVAGLARSSPRALMVALGLLGGALLFAAGTFMGAWLAEDDGALQAGPAIERDVVAALAEGATAAIAPASAPGERLQVTLARIFDPADPGDPANNPERGSRYWVAEVFLGSDGTAPAIVPQWTLATAGGREYGRKLDAGLGADLAASGRLAPGDQAFGLVVFEIPLGAEPLWLRADPDPFAANDLYFGTPPQ